MGFAPGGPPGPRDVSLAEFARRAGLTRPRARTIEAEGSGATRRGRRGAKAKTTVTAGHAPVADALPRKGSPTRPSSRTPSARTAASAASAREGPHQAPRAPGAREEEGRRPAGKPREALRRRPRRGVPEGPGPREGGRLPGPGVPRRLPRDGLPPRHPLRRVLSQRGAGEPPHGRGARVHGHGRARTGAHR